MSETWPILKPETLTDQVYEILRDKILTGKVKPGEFIREQDVSERLNVSRTPVREALARLASESFLERIPHRGFRLPEETVDDLIEIYPIMTALEILATREACELLDDRQLRSYARSTKQYEKAFEKNDVYGGIDANHEFHGKLTERSGNQRLCRMLDELRSKVRSLEIWAFSDIEHWQKSIEEHEEILRAIEKGEVDRALDTLEENRLSTYREFSKKAGSDEPVG